MLWDQVMGNAIIPLLEEDVELVGPTGLDGAHIYHAGASRPVRIPSVEWLIVDEQEEEVMNPIDVQFDIFAREPQCTVIERRMRARLTRFVHRSFGGLNMATLFLDSFTLEFPSIAGVTHKALRYRFRPVRRRAASES